MSKESLQTYPGQAIHIPDWVDLGLNMPEWARIMTQTGLENTEPTITTKRNNRKEKIIDLRQLLQFDETGRCNNAFKLMTRKDVLQVAYNSIKSKPGNMVRGSDRETLDGIPTQWFETTSNDLLMETYRFRPARRVMIPKPNGKKRPLGISSPRDKIIQQSMRIVLEQVLDPKFESSSHGFRTSKGCHSALSQIRKWTGVPWLLEGDIKSFFDNIDHKILAKLIKRHFSEPRLIHLYWKLVKAGYVEWDKKKRLFTYPKRGVPQGSIISPLLSNLILHEFDEYMRKLIEQKHQECKNIPREFNNPEYQRLSKRIQKMRKDLTTMKRPMELRKELRKAIRERNKLRSCIPNPQYVKYTYVRYADDWLVGIWGSVKEVQDLKTKVRIFLTELKLDLSMEKTLITNTRKSKAKFLGVIIDRISIDRSTHNKHRQKIRVASSSVAMTAPIQALTDKLIKNKFVKKLGNRLAPQVVRDLTPLPLKDLILHFRSVLNGITNYYSFADNRPNLIKIYNLLRLSLTLTVRSKARLNHNDFLRTFGKLVKIDILKTDGSTTHLDFAPPCLIKQRNLFLINSMDDPLEHRIWKISRLDPLDQPCANCGARERIEMHHIKHIKTLNVKLSSFDRMVALINRKQVPLCKSCHQKVHNGTYFGFTLTHFRHKKWNGIPKWT